MKSALENETVREAIISSASFPAGAVLAFNLTTCPKNWTLYQRSIGRYIVGVDENGDTGEEIGIELKENENRASGRHAHTYTYAYVGGNVSVRWTHLALRVGEKLRTVDTQHGSNSLIVLN